MTNRTSKQIEAEMESVKEKIRSLETKKQAHGKTIDRAKAARKASAFKAHADGDSKAAATLATARESEIRAAMESEDIDAATSQGRAMFDSLEREWKGALDAEAWAALMVEAETAQKEAEQIDVHASAMAKLLGAHGRRLEQLKNAAHNLGFERVFATVGLRHADRVFAWRMIQEGFAAEFEKPGPQYREAAGYAEILNEQIAAAKVAYDAVKKREADDQDADGHDAQAIEAEAGA